VQGVRYQASRPLRLPLPVQPTSHPQRGPPGALRIGIATGWVQAEVGERDVG